MIPLMGKTRNTLNLINDNSSVLFELGKKTITIGKENCQSSVDYDYSNQWIE